jgi:indolepyruvate ferredoxin oxidoreductase alpha subunit
LNHQPQEKLEQRFLLGNEAIAWGAIEANVDFVAGYPGTPSTEIIQTLAQNAERYGIYVEWSTNEMVAFQNALGASIAGHRAMVTMKHAGLNWIVDPLSIAVLSGVRGGLVIVTADDPNCHSSANEQDNRFFGLFFKILTLEPSDPQMAKDLTAEAFLLSEKTQLPVILRSVTRVSHSRSNVVLGNVRPKSTGFEYTREPERFFVTGSRGLQRHRWQIKQQPVLEELSDSLRFNKLHQNGDEKRCIITSGVAINYVKDALRKLQADELAVLEIASVYPLPKSLITKALSGKEAVLVIEEGGAFVELQVKALATDLSVPVRVLGKASGDIPETGELTVDIVAQSVARFLGQDEPPVTLRREVSQKANEILPPRTMVFCAGCPHTGTILALKEAMRKARVKPFICGDIGCYILMHFPPHELGDAKFSMGSSIGVASGISKALNKKAISIIGDSTFIHAGVPGLINCVYNGSNVTLIICDNRTTAMTGGQPTAATGVTATLKQNKPLDLAGLVKGCGVEFVETVDPYDLETTTEALKNALDYDGVSVVIASRECALTATREGRLLKESSPSYQVDASYQIDGEECVECWRCIELLACPAIRRDGDTVIIEDLLCTGCGICAQVCLVDAIIPRTDSK